MEQLYRQMGEFTPDNLMAGHELPVLVRGITLKGDQGVIKRGTVLGIITASGLAVPVDSSASDGSQTPYCIATDTIDTSAGEVKTTGYISGLFNSKALIFGGTDTLADHEDKLRALQIIVKERVTY